MTAVSTILSILRVHIRDADKASSDLYPLILSAVQDIFGEIPELSVAEDGGVVEIPAALASDNDFIPIPSDLVTATGYRAAYHYFIGDIGSVRDEKRANLFKTAYDSIMGMKKGG